MNRAQLKIKTGQKKKGDKVPVFGEGWHRQVFGRPC